MVPDNDKNPYQDTLADETPVDGDKIEIDILDEQAGWNTDRKWKERVLRRYWAVGERLDNIYVDDRDDCVITRIEKCQWEEEIIRVGNDADNLEIASSKRKKIDSVMEHVKYCPDEVERWTEPNPSAIGETQEWDVDTGVWEDT